MTSTTDDADLPEHCGCIEIAEWLAERRQENQ